MLSLLSIEFVVLRGTREVAADYSRASVAPRAMMNTAVSHVDQTVGPEPVTITEKKFGSEFPPENVYRGEEKVEEYLSKLSNGRIKTVEELIYVFTHNANPAVSPLIELVDDEHLEPTAYKSLIASLNTFFAKAAKDDPQKGGKESLFDILRAPAEASPYSLEGQLQFILDKWGNLLGDTFVARIVRGMDFLREEVIRKNMAHGDFKPDVPLQSFSGGEYQEYERYSPDKEWMPRLVLIAKNSYVWLEQLSVLLRSFMKRLRVLDITVEVSPEAKSFLSDHGFDPALGARPLKRAIQRYLEDPLSEMILAHGIQKDGGITVGVGTDELTFQVTAQPQEDAAQP